MRGRGENISNREGLEKRGLHPAQGGLDDEVHSLTIDFWGSGRGGWVRVLLG